MNNMLQGGMQACSAICIACEVLGCGECHGLPASMSFPRSAGKLQLGISINDLLFLASHRGSNTVLTARSLQHIAFIQRAQLRPLSCKTRWMFVAESACCVAVYADPSCACSFLLSLHDQNLHQDVKLGCILQLCTKMLVESLHETYGHSRT